MINLDDLTSHLVRVLDGVGKNLSVLDCLFAVELAIETDDLDLVFAIGLLHGGVGAEGGGSLIAKMASRSSCACRASAVD